ncbi:MULTISPECIES: hypothetical protein [unclassified Okeania]|nr:MULTISPECIES: hypothetical protein [unclassified Okeania]
MLQLQIAKIFLRSQPTPNSSQEGKLGVRSQESGVRMNGFNSSF